MKAILKNGTALVAATLMTGPALAADMLTEIGPGEGQVNIVAWPGYIERGETDKAFDWVTGFEEATGCKVNVKTANTSDEMVALMNEGGFDLVTASGDASLRMVAGKRVQPINIDLIPSWATLDERLKNAPWHTVDGVHYGTPYMWGPNILMFNTETFPETPQSWNVVFEEMTLPDGKTNAGRVQAFGPEKGDGAGIVPFGQTFSRVVPDQPVMVIDGLRQVQQVLQHQMNRRRLGQILPAHHMGDRLRRIVDHDGQVIGCAHAAPGQHDVADLILQGAPVERGADRAGRGTGFVEPER